MLCRHEFSEPYKLSEVDIVMNPYFTREETEACRGEVICQIPLLGQRSKMRLKHQLFGGTEARETGCRIRVSETYHWPWSSGKQ